MKLSDTMKKIIRRTDRWESFLAPWRSISSIDLDLTNKINCQMYLRIKQFLKSVQHLNSSSSSTFRASNRNLTTQDLQESTWCSLASLLSTYLNNISTTRYRSRRCNPKHSRRTSNNNKSNSISRIRCRFQRRHSMQPCLFTNLLTHLISSSFHIHRCLILTTLCRRQLTSIFHRSMLIFHTLVSSPSRCTHNKWQQDYNRATLPTNNNFNSNNIISQKDNRCPANNYPHLHRTVRIASIVKRTAISALVFMKKLCTTCPQRL